MGEGRKLSKIQSCTKSPVEGTSSKGKLKNPKDTKEGLMGLQLANPVKVGLRGKKKGLEIFEKKSRNHKDVKGNGRTRLLNAQNMGTIPLVGKRN